MDINYRWRFQAILNVSDSIEFLWETVVSNFDWTSVSSHNDQSTKKLDENLYIVFLQFSITHLQIIYIFI